MRTSSLASFITGCLLLALSLGAATASAEGGNSVDAKRCQKSGWQAWFTRDGQAFANADECTAYGAKNELIPTSALVCLNDGWRTLSTISGGSPFVDEQACVDFALAGGTPTVTTGAEISLGYDPVTRVVAVSNAGPLPATVSLDVSFLGVCSASFDWDRSVWGFRISPDGLVTTLAPIPAGQTIGGIFIGDTSCTLGLVGMQVSGSDQPDPDSTPGNHVVTEDDYVVLARAAI